MVDKEIGKPHEIVAPREENRKHSGNKQRPFHRTFHDKQAQNKQHKYQCAHIHGTAGERLVAEVLREHLQCVRTEFAVGSHHVGTVNVGKRLHAGAALHVGHHERPCLADAVAPLGDVFLAQTAVGGFTAHSSLLAFLAWKRSEFAVAAAHSLLSIFI